MSLRERPILFSAPMVRAILEGAKTQTRRVVKPQPERDRRGVMMWSIGRHRRIGFDGKDVHPDLHEYCPYGQPGDRLWVRERWAPHDDLAMRQQDREMVHFWADLPEPLPTDMRWRPSIHMPRWASRITLEVTGVRVERLQDISEADAVAEGLRRTPDGFAWHVDDEMHRASDPRESYWSLWQTINGAGSVEANPWVWCVEFRVIHA